MRALHKVLLNAAALSVLTFSSQAGATMADTFYLDSLTINKCTGGTSNADCTNNDIYVNGFDGAFSGAATPSTVNFTNGASSIWGGTSGSTFSESGSKLALGGAQAVFLPASSVSGKPVYTNQAQLQTPRSTNTNALGAGRDFSVTSVWDLQAPGQDKTRYGMRLNDQGAPTNPNNDILDISVVNHSGVISIEVRDLLADGTPAGDFLLTSFVLDIPTLLGSFDQIALQLSWVPGVASAGMASAAYAFGNGGTLGSWTTLGSWSGVLFSDDSYTRARFYASATVVSEPQVWLLIGTGLLLAALGTRRNTRSVKAA